jgi:hypothetical protein
MAAATRQVTAPPKQNPTALEILHVACRRRLAENAGNRLEVVLLGSAFARQQVHGERDVTGFREAARDILDMAREAAVLVADQHDGKESR